ncbi:unnamed protein product [Thlaspi arvense]|uniref:Uncharacterized protein n=1 Tax=Thlaspi arvense TaxID=13288 RepID=A0AAU9SRH5_THLAR|nr:unnamed protein product [Thlaspi arvense]
MDPRHASPGRGTFLRLPLRLLDIVMRKLLRGRILAKFRIPSVTSPHLPVTRAGIDKSELGVPRLVTVLLKVTEKELLDPGSFADIEG